MSVEEIILMEGKKVLQLTLEVKENMYLSVPGSKVKSDDTFTS